MSAARLREAAALLRERAGAARAGRWIVAGDPAFVVSPRNEWEAPVTRCHGSLEEGNHANAAYIAMMHPPLAEAFADWLDLAADDHDAGCPSDCPATRVADEILGGDR